MSYKNYKEIFYFSRLSLLHGGESLQPICKPNRIIRCCTRTKESGSQRHGSEDKLLFQSPVVSCQVAVEVSIPREGISNSRYTGAIGGTWQEPIAAASQWYLWWTLQEGWGDSFMQGQHCLTLRHRNLCLPRGSSC